MLYHPSIYHVTGMCPCTRRVLSEHLQKREVARLLLPCIGFGIPIVIHPDILQDKDCWMSFKSLLCIENMDKRKSTGRTTRELEPFFSMFPDATFCLDIGHVCQIDSTMSEARRMLRRFGDRLRQLHISEIDAQGHHHGVTLATILAAHNVANLINPGVPAIIESQIPGKDIPKEFAAVEQALNPSSADNDYQDWGALA